MRFSLALFFVLLLSNMAVFPAFAGDDPDRVIFAVGKYNVRDDESFQRENDVRAELRLARFQVWKFHPWLGIELADESVGWFGGGLETDIDLWGDWLMLTLQTGAGYFEDGNEPIPGMQFNPKSGLEFRHQIELAVRFPAGNRIGLGYSHMSNANIGGGNNAVESLMINFHIPVNFTPERKSVPPRE